MASASPSPRPLGDATLVGFVGSSDLRRSRSFYEGTLGLQVVEHDDFACVVLAGRNTVRVTAVGTVVVAPYTVLGWEVDDIEDVVRRLSSRGVAFRRIEGLPQDELNIWTTPGGGRVAWFTDPDGHTLSLTQPVSLARR